MIISSIVAAALGYAIGIERQVRRHQAGMRTYALVSLGACLFCSLAEPMSDASPSRVLSQVCSGLGFLGAGVILKDGTKIQGLTTAATIWVCGAIGAMCAYGDHWNATAIVGLVVLINLCKVKRAIKTA